MTSFFVVGGFHLLGVVVLPAAGVVTVVAGARRPGMLLVALAATCPSLACAMIAICLMLTARELDLGTGFVTVTALAVAAVAVASGTTARRGRRAGRATEQVPLAQ